MVTDILYMWYFRELVWCESYSRWPVVRRLVLYSLMKLMPLEVLCCLPKNLLFVYSPSVILLCIYTAIRINEFFMEGECFFIIDNLYIFSTYFSWTSFPNIIFWNQKYIFQIFWTSAFILLHVLLLF